MAQNSVSNEFDKMNPRPRSPNSVAHTNTFETNSDGKINAQLPEGWSIAKDPNTGNHYCYNAEGDSYFIAKDDQGNQYYHNDEGSVWNLPTPSQKFTQKLTNLANEIRSEARDAKSDTNRMESERIHDQLKQEARAVLDGKLTSLNFLKDSFTASRTEESNLEKQLQDIEYSIGELNQYKEDLENELQKLERQITSLKNKALENKDDQDTLNSIEKTSKNNLAQQKNIKNKLSDLKDEFSIVREGKSQIKSLYNQKVKIGDDLEDQLDIAKADYSKQFQKYQNEFLSDG